MAYVPVPKDLSKIKTKLAFNLTKRQLVCFSSAAAVGLPAYLFSRGSIGNSAAMFFQFDFDSGEWQGARYRNGYRRRGFVV